MREEIAARLQKNCVCCNMPLKYLNEKGKLRSIAKASHYCQKCFLSTLACVVAYESNKN